MWQIQNRTTDHTIHTVGQGCTTCGRTAACDLRLTFLLLYFCFTSPEPVRPKEAFDSVSTIRDVGPSTVELAVRFSLHTQCKRCSTGTYITPFSTEVIRETKPAYRRSYAPARHGFEHLPSTKACPTSPPFLFTSPQPVRPKEASYGVSTIRDVMSLPLTVELAVRFSLRTQCSLSAARQALAVHMLFKIYAWVLEGFFPGRDTRGFFQIFSRRSQKWWNFFFPTRK